jgi:hypothetical protein
MNWLEKTLGKINERDPSASWDSPMQNFNPINQVDAIQDTRKIKNRYLNKLRGVFFYDEWSAGSLQRLLKKGLASKAVVTKIKSAAQM